MPDLKIDSVDPSSGKNDKDTKVIIKGDGFGSGTVKPTVKHASKVKRKDTKTLEVTFPKGMKPGKYDVEVKLGSQTKKKVKGFEVKAPPPFVCFTAGGQIYLEWKASDYSNPAKYNIYRGGSKIDTVNKDANKTSAGKEYYVDIQTSDGNKYKYKIEADYGGAKKGESEETAEIEVKVFNDTQNSELHFFGDNDTDTGSIGSDELIAKFTSGKLDKWCLMKTYMCKKSTNSYIYSTNPAHKSTGGKKNEIEEVKKKFDGNTGAGNVPHKKGIHKCDTGCFGAEHKSDKKTSILLLPISGDTAGFYWQVHEKAPPSGKKMSEVTGATKIGTSNRKIIWVGAAGLSNLTYSTVAHEFQHLLYYGHDEDASKGVTWLNEGLSVYSVDLNNYWTGNNLYESRIVYFQDAYKNAFAAGSDNGKKIATLRLTDTEWSNLTDVQYGYALSGIWTLYMARRFPGKIDEYGKAKDDHGTDVFKQATVSTDASDTFKNVFSEWALANYLNKYIVDIKKNSKPITMLSDISNFTSDIDKGKYNYYVQVDNPDIKDGVKALKMPNTNLCRELVVKTTDGIVQANAQKEKPTTPYTDLDIIKSSVAYLKFKVNATASDEKRLHVHIKSTGDIIKMYSIEAGRDNKTCFVIETVPSGSKEISYTSHDNLTEVMAILPNHTTSKESVKYIAYHSEKPKVKKITYKQSGIADKETLAANKNTTLELENGTETTIKILFDQEMITGNGKYTSKDGDTLAKLAEKYYGDATKKDLITAPNDPPNLGDQLEIPVKIWYVYESETAKNEISSLAWSKTQYTNDTLTVKCTPDASKKKKITLYICCAANYGKDIMLPENKYNFKVKVVSPSFDAD